MKARSHGRGLHAAKNIGAAYVAKVQVGANREPTLWRRPRRWCTGSSAPVQATLTSSADVKGEAALTIKIKAPELIKAFHDAQREILLKGPLNTNGPGSTGRSSQDAQAP
jgi:hypothetical protein